MVCIGDQPSRSIHPLAFSRLRQSRTVRSAMPPALRAIVACDG
jgi:hypothetical protein